MGEKKHGVLAPLLGSAVFFCVAPGVVAGVAPGAIASWQIGPPLLGLGVFRVVGVMLIIVGVGGLLDSTARFVLQGHGTPAPLASPSTLVVSGLYRHVRNPMYVAIVAAILGQAMLFGSIQVLGYTCVVWCFFHFFVIAYEEPTLQWQFGENYGAYRACVRRWWPRIKPWNPAEARNLEVSGHRTTWR
ncbi:MAG: isoprenylcysteine carboxylmethyltransferase family protein [Thermodesulfobacteriota bacterium]